MLNKFLDNQRNVYILAILAIVFESLSSSVLKFSKDYAFLSPMYLFWFAVAVGIMGLYAIAWQLLLERVPLTTAYLRKGLTYVLIFIWARVFFHEEISVKQMIGMAIIIAGMIISMSGDREAEPASGHTGAASAQPESGDGGDPAGRKEV